MERTIDAMQREKKTRDAERGTQKKREKKYKKKEYK